jgi:hypothetical protein
MQFDLRFEVHEHFSGVLNNVQNQGLKTLSIQMKNSGFLGNCQTYVVVTIFDIVGIGSP